MILIAYMGDDYNRVTTGCSSKRFLENGDKPLQCTIGFRCEIGITRTVIFDVRAIDVCSRRSVHGRLTITSGVDDPISLEGSDEDFLRNNNGYPKRRSLKGRWQPVNNRCERINR